MIEGKRASLLRLSCLTLAIAALALLGRPQAARGQPGSSTMCDERSWVDSQGKNVTTHKFGGGACYGTPYAVHTSEDMGYCSEFHPACP